MDAYLALKLVWWLLLGVLLVGVAVMVGMDMGVGILLRFVGRSDDERRVAINIIGPHWDGNQVWFVLGGGAIFAAWPLVYATAFAGLYIVMLVLLWSMIVRPLAFEYRGKRPSPRWRNGWDWCFFVSGFVPMLVFGAAIGNLLQGIPFAFDWRLASRYDGSFVTLLDPFAILCGALAVAMAVYMGGARLMTGSEEPIHGRARRAALVAGTVAVVLFTVGGIWLQWIEGFRLLSGPPPAAVQTPLHQTVERATGAWLDNFHRHAALWLVPLLAYAGMLLGTWALARKRALLGWWLGALAWTGILGTVGVAMFPFLLPSSTMPSHSLTVWNAGSSERTLAWMLGFTVVFMPLIVWYTSWAFWVMRGKVTPASLHRRAS